MNRIIDLLDDGRLEEAIILFASDYPDLAWSYAAWAARAIPEAQYWHRNTELRFAAIILADSAADITDRMNTDGTSNRTAFEAARSVCSACALARMAKGAGPIPDEQADKLREIAEQVALISRLKEQLDCAEEQLNGE